jgi:hypothetical protein
MKNNKKQKHCAQHNNFQKHDAYISYVTARNQQTNVIFCLFYVCVCVIIISSLSV